MLGLKSIHVNKIYYWSRMPSPSHAEINLKNMQGLWRTHPTPETLDKTFVFITYRTKTIFCIIDMIQHMLFFLNSAIDLRKPTYISYTDLTFGVLSTIAVRSCINNYILYNVDDIIHLSPDINLSVSVNEAPVACCVLKLINANEYFSN